MKDLFLDADVEDGVWQNGVTLEFGGRDGTQKVIVRAVSLHSKRY